jgi:8-oxo-dGTP diphosphatase
MPNPKYSYDYPRPMLGVDAVILNTGHSLPKVLLIKRRNDPFVGQWALPGGFVEADEPLKDAAARELQEETGLQGITLTQLRAFGAPGRDPRGWSVAVAYLGILNDADTSPEAGDDAVDAQWFNVDDLPALAFDHNDIVRYAMQEFTCMSRQNQEKS